jgi:hypothetical protein
LAKRPDLLAQIPCEGCFAGPKIPGKYQSFAAEIALRKPARKVVSLLLTGDVNDFFFHLER